MGKVVLLYPGKFIGGIVQYGSVGSKVGSLRVNPARGPPFFGVWGNLHPVHYCKGGDHRFESGKQSAHCGLVSTHLSDVYSHLQTAAMTISTSKLYVPLAPQTSDDEPPPEHAQHSAVRDVFFSHSVRVVLLRLRFIHNGLTAELVSLPTETPPIGRRASASSFPIQSCRTQL